MAAEQINCWRVALLGLVVAACGSAAAQTSPDTASATAPPGPETRQMIEALKPPASRGMRNLQVRPAAPQEAASSAASLAPTPTPAQPTTAALAPAPVAAPVPVPVAVTVPVSVPAPLPAPVPDITAEPAPSLTLPIRFDPNSARVRPENGALLGNLVAAMMSPDLKASRFVIEGHTDASGMPAANLLLSQQRADEVRLYLVALGVHPARLKTLGKGSTEPANPKEPLSAENRRVRVVTLE